MKRSVYKLPLHSDNKQSRNGMPLIIEGDDTTQRNTQSWTHKQQNVSRKKYKTRVLVAMSLIKRCLLTTVDCLTANMNVPRSFETSGNIYEYKQRNIPEDLTHQHITWPIIKFFVYFFVPMV